MLTAIDYLTKKGWKISSDPRNYKGYPKNYGYRNYIENGVNYDSFCNGYHRAFDVYSNATDNVPAVTSGTVITSNTHGNFGGTIEIRDSNGNDWIYGHLQRQSLKFSVGDKVNQGDIVGLQGSSNYYDNPMSAHLHIQLRPKETKTDEVSLVCSGMPIEKYDITKLNQKLDQSKNKGASKMSKKFMIVAGHGESDPGAVGNGTNERDFIRANIVDNIAKYLKKAGHKADVFPKEYDMLQATFNGTNKNGLYWVKAQGYDEVIEFHLDAASPSASGGHTIVWHTFNPDSIDKGIQNALANTVGVIRGITGRDNLGNPRVASQLGLSYRLVELGFITSKKDMDYIKNNLQAFTKAITEGINGGKIGNDKPAPKPQAKPKPTPKPKPVSKPKPVPKTKWNWKGRFHPNAPKDGIVVRKQPGLKGATVGQDSWLFTKKDWVDFDQVIKKDSYWWVRFKYPTNPKAGYFYAPVCKITDKNEKMKKEKYWGTINWK